MRRFLDNKADANRFRPLEPECTVIQFCVPLSSAELEMAAALIAVRPDVQLYVYGNAATNLDFLAAFRNLRRFHLAIYELDHIQGITNIADRLETLTFSSTKKPFSLKFLESCVRLKDLFIVGHKKDISSLARLHGLQRLGLSGITLPDLALLLPLRALRDFSLFLGGTNQLDQLAELPYLEDLNIMRVTKLSQLDVLARLHKLRRLRLDWMRNVTQLPSFAGLPSLEAVTLDTMKGITDLSPIADAPSLRRLVIQAMPQLTAENFRCLVGHPQLKELHAYTGRSRVNEMVRLLFPGVAQ